MRGAQDRQWSTSRLRFWTARCLYAETDAELPGVHKYEDLEVWKQAFSLVKSIYAITRSATFRDDYGLRNQIRRAAVSAMSNIAEGFGRRSRIEFSRFLDISRGSVLEVQSLLYVGRSQKCITEGQFVELYDQCMILGRRLGAMMHHLHATRPRSR